MMNDKLLSDVDINRVKDRFEKETSDVQDEAIKKHVSIFIKVYCLYSTIYLLEIHHFGYMLP